MNPQVQEYVKQAIRSLRYAQIECQIGNPPNFSMANTLGGMADSLISLLNPQPPPATAVDQKANESSQTTINPTDVVHAAPNVSY